MGTLFQDLRYGLRMLAKNPGFTVVAVITLALGIGANTALFSVINGVLLNPLRYTEPDRLVALYTRTPQALQWSISYPNFLDWVRDNRSFSGLAAYRSHDFNLTGMGEAERVPADMISASFFDLLGVKPALGRTFLSEEDQVGSKPVALISGGFWKRKFGSSNDVLDKTLTLDGTVYAIVGVIPSDFYFIGWNFQQPADVFVPIGQWNDPAFRDRKVPMGMNAIGRLKPGVTFAQAKADMDAIGRHLAEAYPDADKDTGITLVPLKQDTVGDIQPILLVLLAAVGFVLLIACVNVANLLLARSTGRTREFAVRTALGAGRGRVVRQLLTESILLALSGGGLGLLLASWGTQAALKVLPQALPRAQEIHLDGRVLLFSLGASVLAGILFGLAPALKTSHADLHETLKEGGRGSSGARHRLQGTFVVVEMALALVLLVGAGLMIRSLAGLWRVNPGFDPHNVLAFDLSFPATINSPNAIRAAWRLIHDSLNAVPGVAATSVSGGAIPMWGDMELPFWTEGPPKPSSQSDMRTSLFYLVQPDYLKVMKIPLVHGRFLLPQDDEHSPLVIVIDDRFARLAFRGQDPVGKRVSFDILNITAEVVGVVGHVKQWGLDENPASPIQAQCYFPILQIPDRLMMIGAGGIRVMVRTTGSPLAETAPIRKALGQINGQMVMYHTRTMSGIISQSLAARRFSMILLGIFAALALVMSCVGIYGVISYVTGQRTHEIGIRLALGADRRDVLWMILGEGAKMALLGVAIGLLASFGLTRLMTNMLFGVSALDPLSFVAVAGLLIVVALAACYFPARRATEVDPMVALRCE
jgi:predicted permease